MTVAFVAVSLLSAGAPRPFLSARVFGGPTDGEWLALRVEVVEVVEGLGGEAVEQAVSGGHVALGLRAGDFEVRRSPALDVEGAAELGFRVPRGPRPFEVVVERAGEELLRGRLELSAERWANAARRRGGWFSTEVDGFEVRVAPARGALAVPFREAVWVEVRRGGAALAGARLAASATGGRVEPKQTSTDGAGRAVLELTPEEHTLGLELNIEKDGASARARLALPVVPGAQRARLEPGGQLLIESPVPRSVAYVALVSERQRLFGRRVELRPEASGGSSARVQLPELPDTPSHAIVASARDLRSPGAVGWPLQGAASGEPAMTFDAVDALLADGRARGSERERARRARVRWATVAVCAVAVLLELALLLSFTRKRDRMLDAHLARQGVEGREKSELAPARSLSIVAAVALVALGFLLLALIALVRVR